MSLWPCAVTGTRSKGAGGMGRSVRFLLTFSWPNLGAIFGFAGIVIAGCCATGVPGNTERGNLFESYYAMFPVIILLCLFLYAFALCTNNLNLGLSMGRGGGTSSGRSRPISGAARWSAGRSSGSCPPSPPWPAGRSGAGGHFCVCSTARPGASPWPAPY